MGHEGRLDLDEIRALIQLATEADITELDVDAPHVKVRIKKAHRNSAGRIAVDLTPPAAAAAADDPEIRLVPIAAPMVGTFYRSAKPDAAPFVSEGDEVHIGQTVCILEAMKLFNEIPSDVDGRIVRILVESGAPVEYGQPLFLVDPAA
ncbi:MAG TPA: acetyl-CoA carboxylase biotin carboxyl carrier protein [bacterium]|nr:acetyl-CoA carboxylase biotin carboxyl carrier protein [bacterium]